jgi:hypothetical protein
MSRRDFETRQTTFETRQFCAMPRKRASHIANLGSHSSCNTHKKRKITGNKKENVWQPSFSSSFQSYLLWVRYLFLGVTRQIHHNRMRPSRSPFLRILPRLPCNLCHPQTIFRSRWSLSMPVTRRKTRTKPHQIIWMARSQMVTMNRLHPGPDPHLLRANTHLLPPSTKLQLPWRTSNWC